MLESYIAPMLMSYVNKYIKNLKPSDLQLSLWGGDVVLNNLDLRLDVLEQELKLPITFLSGHIHELRVHVPWARLGYEPVVITINTIECVLKLRDASPGETDSASSNSKTSTASSRASSIDRSKVKRQLTGSDADLPPGYVQTLINRVVNNVSIVVNNLILKYVEDDIVLSLNIKSAEGYSVNEFWDSAFIDLSIEDLVLRKLIKFSDMTVCLDKRTAAGKIEMYQEPMIFRCSFETRIFMIYDNLSAKLPYATKINTFCEEVNISISDIQLPMYLRLIQLCTALYYGDIDLPEGQPQQEGHDLEDRQELTAGNSGAVDESDPQQDYNDQQGWGSWMWSMVPELVTFEEEEGEGEGGGRGRPTKPAEPILAFSAYVKKAVVTFKLTELTQENMFYGPQKLIFKPYLRLEQDGSSMEILMRGETFFDAQIGFTKFQLTCMDEDETTTREMDPCFLKAGEPVENKTGSHFFSLSLFDERSPENNRVPPDFVLDVEMHQRLYNETAMLQRYGAFWMDYLYTMEIEDRNVSESGSDAGSHSSHQDMSTVRESSSKRFLFAPGQVTVTSEVIQKLLKLQECANNHEYEPYSQPKPVVVDENRPRPTLEEVAAMEEFIPTRSMHVTLLSPTVYVCGAERLETAAPEAQEPRKGRRVSREDSKQKLLEPPKPPEQVFPLPTKVIQADRIDIQNTVPMYRYSLVPAVSSLLQPSGNLIHHCYSHIYVKVFGFQVGLTTMEPSNPSPAPLTVLPPCSTAVYYKTLLLPMYWRDPLQSQTEVLLELPGVVCTLTQPQLQLLHLIQLSWTGQPRGFHRTSLVEDVFNPSAKAFPVGQPMVEVSLSGLEWKYVETLSLRAVSGTVGGLKITVHSIENGKEAVTPILAGPVDTSQVHNTKFFTIATEEATPSNLTSDLLTLTLQVGKDASLKPGHSLVLLDIQGLSCCLDPVLLTWLAYRPRPVWRKASSPHQLHRQSSVITSVSTHTGTRHRHSSQESAKSESKHRSRTRTSSQPIPMAHLTSPQEPPKTEERKPDGTVVIKRWLHDMFPVVRQLQVQVDLQPLTIFFPTDHISTIPQSSRSLLSSLQTYYTTADKPHPMLAVCLPRIKVCSSGHKHMEALQDIPYSPDRPFLETDLLPWNISLEKCSVYTVHDSQGVYYLLEPTAVTSVLAVTCSGSPPSGGYTSLGICFHTDLQPVALNCSKQQVQLLSSLAEVGLNVLEDLQSRAATTGPSPSVLGSKPTETVSTVLSSPSRSPTKHLQSISDSSELEDLGSGTSTDETVISAKDGESSQESNVGKVSLWLQWALPKVKVTLYGQDHLNTTQDVKICTEVEDLSASIDVQEVYTKVKCKVGTLNVNHKVKKSQSHHWEPGPFNGIVLSCSEKLSNLTQLPALQSRETRTNPFFPEFAKLAETTKPHGFLSITFTRALTTCVRKKIAKRERGEKASKEKTWETDMQYMNEICLTVEPCDVIFWCPLLASALKIFQLENGESPKEKPKASVIGTKSTHALMIATSSLPLLHFNCSNFRLFVPVDESPLNKPLQSDLLLLHVNSVSLTPQADNPLPRLVVRKDVYRRAVHAGKMQTPGSEVEDRQYQLDVNGLGLCSALWEEVARSMEQGRQVESEEDLLISQNPAVEWNRADKQPHHQEPVHLTPIVMDYDMRVVVAPAVIVNRHSAQDSHTRQPVIVCGHSLEVNVTSDLDFYISVEQVQLMHHLMDRNLSAMLGGGAQEGPKSRSNSDESSRGPGAGTRPPASEDSGIGSDSTLIPISATIERQSAELHPSLLEKQTKTVERSTEIMPMDILLTAGKISLMLYSSSFKKEEPSSSQISPQPTKMVSPFLPMGLSAIFSSSFVQESMMGKRVLKPFVHAVFSQPSTIINVQSTSQKLEVSCYDVSLKGVPVDLTITDGSKLLPEAGDFSVPWVQTAMGEPDPRSGVPPAVYTFTVTDFLSDQANVRLDVGRPLKVNFSITKVKQAMGLLKLLTPTKQYEIQGKLSPTVPQKDSKSLETTSQKKTEAEKTTSMPPTELKALLARLRSASFAIGQVVVAMETVPHPQNPKAVLSLTGIDSKVEITLAENGNLTATTCDTVIKDFLVKTSLHDKMRPLLGPLTSELSLACDWSTHSGSQYDPHQPKLNAGIHLGIVRVFFGQEHLNCAQLMTEHVQEFVGEMTGKTKNLKRPEPDVPPTTTEANKPPIAMDTVAMDTVISSRDDLRVGTFQYISNRDGGERLPSPGQIVFTKERRGQPGTMAWCYHKPRVLTYVHVTPVPFHTMDDPDISFTELEEFVEVPCSLQYWDEVRKAFVLFHKFKLSASRSYHVRFADIAMATANQVVAAQLWQVVVHSGTEGQGETDFVFISGSGDACPAEDESDPLLSPMALAACMRVDSCFAPKFVPAVSASLSANAIQISISNHMEHLGKGPIGKMQPFTFDDSMPNDQEFLVVSLEKPLLHFKHWHGERDWSSVQMEGSVGTDVLEYRNLTMQPLVEPFKLQGELMYRKEACVTHIDTRVSTDPIHMRVAQGTVHTLTMAQRLWAQNFSPTKTEDEQLVLNYFLICNDTQETIRFGQVDTDENVVLCSRRMHGYSWRTHKQVQMLHVCFEGWGNWRWSEPFNIDTPGAFVRTIQHQGHTTSLIVKVQPITPLQKKITFCGRQVFTNHLSKDLQLEIVQVRKSQPALPRDLTCDLPARTTLPSFVLEDDMIRGVRLRAQGEFTVWSGEVDVGSTKQKETSHVQISCEDGSVLQVLCTVYNLQPSTPQHMPAWALPGQRVIVLSPVFVVRSWIPGPLLMNLETRNLGERHQYQVMGKGKGHDLYNIEPELSHHVTFQFGKNGEPSSPTIRLNSELIGEVDRKPSPPTVESLCSIAEGSEEDVGEGWPFSGHLHAGNHDTNQDLAVFQPTTELKVTFAERSPYIDTLLLNVAPWCLLGNNTMIDLVLVLAGGETLDLPAGQAVAPPKFRGEFCISVKLPSSADDDMSDLPQSLPILLETEDVSPSAKYGERLIMPQEGLGLLNIVIPASQLGGATKVCSLCVSSSVQHGIQVLRLQERVFLANLSSRPLRVQALTADAEDRKGGLQDQELKTIEVAMATSSKNKDTMTPIALWDAIGTDQSEGSKDARWFDRGVQYMRFSLANQDSACTPEGNPKHEIWSPAYRLGSFLRYSLSVPDWAPDGTCRSVAMVATVNESQGQLYVVVDEDPCPRFILHNNCHWMLHFGEAATEEQKLDGIPVKEELTLSGVPTIPPNSSTCYYPESLAASFPEFTEASNISSHVHIRLAGEYYGAEWSEDEGFLFEGLLWTQALDICEKKEHQIGLPGFGEVRVRISSMGTCKHVYIDPVKREEVGSDLEFVEFDDVSEEVKEGKNDKTPSKHTVSLSAKQGHSSEINKVTATSTLALQCGVFISEACLILVDEVSNPSLATELLRMTADKCHLSYHPVSTNMETSEELLQVCAWRIQVDNQIFHKGNYDFSVLLCPEHKEEEGLQPRKMWSIEKTADFWAYHSMVVAKVGLHRTLSDNKMAIGSVKLAQRPMTVYIEDTFIYDILNLIGSFSIPAASDSTNRPMRTHVLPREVKEAATSLIGPVSIPELTIEEMTMLVSVHASMKVFISSDHTRLTFKNFSRAPVFTVSRNLVQDLALHYGSGALFRAGWVLGSLDILGSPASLLGSFSSGISDFFRLPYEGLTRGPGAFVSGVTKGASSLVRHVSAGTLTSIVNLANSISRNMDRLSLDQDHAHRNQEWRRRLPAGVTTGLVQGLSGLGLSLLGAIAGVVDQPIQSIQFAMDSSEKTVTQRATGVISGVGKGLVGVVAKPIGGAAEFVAQTGQGILQGAGLTHLPRPRCTPNMREACDAENGQVKYTWKMLQALSLPDICVHLPGSMVTPAGQLHPVVLLLTPLVLFVVSVADDTQQQAFSILDIEVKRSSHDPGSIKVKVSPQKAPTAREKEEQKERVSEFIDMTLGLPNTSPSNAESDTPSDVSAVPSPDFPATCYKFELQEQYRDLFVSMFQQAKKKAQGKGFY
ncbi:VPS13B [Branchiostoma lanceolatum]|uniref:VPS13B protein n=1 Tax=Branchiostoma lanceolatum TaxID=7740 RepID=A0A8J9Z5W3_BRALA|nr:VPS13B [Branchiostoma lanceolatum]